MTVWVSLCRAVGAGGGCLPFLNAADICSVTRGVGSIVHILLGPDVDSSGTGMSYTDAI